MLWSHQFPVRFHLNVFVCINKQSQQRQQTQQQQQQGRKRTTTTAATATKQTSKLLKFQFPVQTAVGGISTDRQRRRNRQRQTERERKTEREPKTETRRQRPRQGRGTDRRLSDLLPIHKRDQKDSQWELGICGPRLRCGHSRQVQSANCVKINEINFILIFVQQIPQRNYHNKLFFRLHNNTSSNSNKGTATRRACCTSNLSKATAVRKESARLGHALPSSPSFPPSSSPFPLFAVHFDRRE